MKITAKQVWETALQDEIFAAKPEEEQKALRRFIQALPRLLKPYMDLEVNPTTLAQARSLYGSNAIENGLVKAILPALGESMGGMFSFMIDMMEPMIAGMLETRRDLMLEIAGDTHKYLRRNNITEDEFMSGPVGDLNAQALKEYRSGGLTIGRLLEIDPLTFAGARLPYQ
jgi:hypothetical protein